MFFVVIVYMHLQLKKYKLLQHYGENLYNTYIYKDTDPLGADRSLYIKLEHDNFLVYSNCIEFSVYEPILMILFALYSI